MRHSEGVNNVAFISLHSHCNVARLIFGRTSSGTLYSTTGGLNHRCYVRVGNAIDRQRDGGPGVSANSVRVLMGRLGILSRDRAPPFAVRSGASNNSSVHVGCHCLSLHHPTIHGGLRLHRHVYVLVHGFLSSRGFVRIRAPVLVNDAPRNTHSFMIPSHVGPNRFCTLPRDPRALGRLLVMTNFSHCFRVTGYFHSRSLHTSHRPRFARVSYRVDFMSRSSIVSLFRRVTHRLFGRVHNMRLPGLRRVA